MSQTKQEQSILFIRRDGARGTLRSSNFADFTERHHIVIDPPTCIYTSNKLKAKDLNGHDSLLIEMDLGWAGRRALASARLALARGLRVYFYWPNEKAVEVIDRANYKSFRKLFLLVNGYRILRKVKNKWHEIKKSQPKVTLAQPVTVPSTPNPDAPIDIAHLQKLLKQRVSPKMLHDIGRPDTLPRIKGLGVYIRLNFWDNVVSGGSIGHTAYVAKKLSQRTERFHCIMGTHYPLLDSLGVDQTVIAPPDCSGVEPNMLAANNYYVDRLRLIFACMQPAYVYERPVPGNYAVAELCRELEIPYFVEFNGSETTMMREFNDRPYDFEDIFLKAETLGFHCSSAISAISEEVKKQAVELGADPKRILINPNGADPDDYGPDKKIRSSERARFGFANNDVVIGFIGTFGGWHGIDVLAKVLAPVCNNSKKVKFLLIGHGVNFSMVEQQVADHNLQDQVILTGCVPQEMGREHLKACDIFISPHHKHMGDIKFFGSPTKLFEYMAGGCAIVASDFMQLGAVLKPALVGADYVASNGKLAVDNAERAILTEPGNAEELADTLKLLVKDKALRKKLGANARRALLDFYSWDVHVDRFLSFTARLGGDKSYLPESYLTSDLDTDKKSITTSISALSDTRGETLDEKPESGSLKTGDYFKDEVQNQWDNDPCGSHYVKTNPKERLAWFEESRRFRYDEYAPWKFEVMEFDRHSGETVLEIGGGMGNDLSQFAKNGSITTDFDLSGGHLELAKENFELQGLKGTFIHGDAENLPSPNESFDVVYSNGVIHHTPNTYQVVDHIHRILHPGGKAIIMIYAEDSIQYWRDIIYSRGLQQEMLWSMSPGEIMSRNVEISEHGARPLVKVYSKSKIRKLFDKFTSVSIVQRQLMPHERPRLLKWLPASQLQAIMGWNYIVKAIK